MKKKKRTVRKSAKKIAIINYKGGVGKSTMTVNVATALADKGLRILVVDCDPQGNSTINLMGTMPENAESIVTLAYSLKEGTDLEIYETKWGVDIIASLLVDYERQHYIMSAYNDPYALLKGGLQGIEKSYDYIFFDCPPNPEGSVFSRNAIQACEGIVVPVYMSQWSLLGLEIAISKAEKEQKEFHGICVTRWNKRATKISRRFENNMKQTGYRVFHPYIPETVDVVYAADDCVPLVKHKPSSTAAKAYLNLAENIAEVIS